MSRPENFLFPWIRRAAQAVGAAYARLTARSSAAEERPPYRYVIAVLLVLVATLTRLAFFESLGTRFAFIFLYPAVMLSALYGGLGPGIFATALSALAADYFWVGPRHWLGGNEPADWVGLIVFSLTCAFISVVSDRLLRAQARVRRYEEYPRLDEAKLSRLRSRADESSFLAEKARAVLPANVGFALALAVLFMVGLLIYRNAAALREADRASRHSQLVIGALDQLFSDVQDAETGQRGFLITDDERYLAPYQKALARLNADLSALHQLAKEAPAQQRRVFELQAAISSKLAELKRTMELRRASGYEAARREVLTRLGRPYMDEVTRLVAATRNEETRLLQATDATKQARMRRDLWAGLDGGLVAIGLLTLAFIALRLETVQRALATDELLVYRHRLEELVAERTAALQESEASLRRATEELEERVRERTAELVRLNAALLDEIERRKQAQETLARSRREFQTLTEHSPDIVARHDRQFRHLYMSPAIQEVTGLPAEEFIGRTDREMGLPPRLVEKMEAAFRRVFETAKEVSLDLDYTVGGEVRHFNTVVVPELGEDGRVSSALEVSRDITERKRIEMEVELLLAATRVVSEAPAFSKALEDILKVICRVNGWEFADAYLPSSDGRRLEFAAAWSSRPEEFKDFLEESRSTVFSPGVSLTGRTWSGKEPLWVDDAAGLADSPRLRGILKAGFKGLLSIPVAATGRVLVVLNFFMRNPDMLKDRQRIQILHAMGHQLGAFLLRKRAEEEREALRREFLEAQKLEAVGRLAGGVAHDFANVLSAVVGTSELLLADSEPASRSYGDLKLIRDSALHGVSLIKQLLAIGRSSAEAAGASDLNSVIAGMEQMLRRVLPENIRLELRLGRGLWPVTSGKGHLEQIVMNLVVNARDAMPTGGRLAIETDRGSLNPAQAAELGLPPGDYAVLSISDTGMGMSPEVQARIFEPFFTTKPAGMGTGLGLATVHHIMTLIGGRARVESQLGRGSTFRLYFQRSTAAVPRPRPEKPPGAEAPPPGWEKGCETVLWVEDDPVVRAVAQEILSKAGYQVFAAESGARAEALAKAHRGAIRLLLTDVELGDTDGFSLARAVSEVLPGVPVAYVSGYSSRDVLAEARSSRGFTGLIPKPFTIESLLKGVRRALLGAVGAAG